MNEARSKQLFSVASSAQRSSIKARAIVTHFGDGASGGEWSCSKDGNSLCVHQKSAQRYLKQLGGCSVDSENETVDSDIGEPFDNFLNVVLTSASSQLVDTRTFRALVEFLQFHIDQFLYQCGLLYPQIPQSIDLHQSRHLP